MPYVSTAEAANRYGVTDRHIRNLCASGKLDCVKLGKLWRVMLPEEDEPPQGQAATARR